jgi:hypothetical protein
MPIASQQSRSLMPAALAASTNSTIRRRNVAEYIGPRPPGGRSRPIQRRSSFSSFASVIARAHHARATQSRRGTARTNGSTRRRAVSVVARGAERAPCERASIRGEADRCSRRARARDAARADRWSVERDEAASVAHGDGNASGGESCSPRRSRPYPTRRTWSLELAAPARSLTLRRFGRRCRPPRQAHGGHQRPRSRAYRPAVQVR